MITVPGYGRSPNTVLVIGEAPGRQEALEQIPFVGESGQEQERYFDHHGLNVRAFYRTNTIKEYREGNPDPTPEQIRYWTPVLFNEIFQVNPRVIVTVGRFSTRWFIGESADLDTLHGIPLYAGALDSSRVNRAPKGCIIVPVIHPAAGLHSESNDTISLIHHDYGVAADVIKKVKQGRVNDIYIPRDEYEGREIYRDVSGSELVKILKREGPDSLAIDTEGTPRDPWSIQVCFNPGESYLLRVERDNFHSFTTYFQKYVDAGLEVIMHNAMYDIGMCRAMGLDLYRSNLFDTMYAAYLMRLEPQGLKAQAFRWLRMKMKSHAETVGALGSERQVEYLKKVMQCRWDEPEEIILKGNDGRYKSYNPWKIGKSAARILSDYEKWGASLNESDGEANKEGLEYGIAEVEEAERIEKEMSTEWGASGYGEEVEQKYGGVEPFKLKRRGKDRLEEGEENGNGKKKREIKEVDIIKRWRKIHREVRKPVERVLGEMPQGSMKALAQKDFALALNYSCKDSDATLRLRMRQGPVLEERGQTDLMSRGMALLPVFESMQHRGMPGNVKKFVILQNDMDTNMDRVQSNMSLEYNGDKPFNPASPDQVRAILIKRGLRGAKRTKTGKMSTSKQSIEHLKVDDSFVKDLFEWRSYLKIKGFTKTVLLQMEDLGIEVKYDGDLSRIDSDGDNNNTQFVQFPVKTTRTATRRIASFLLTIPSRTELGLRVRDCFQAPEGYTLASWDLSQIEMRYMAHESKDRLLCRLFIEPCPVCKGKKVGDGKDGKCHVCEGTGARDVHRETASRIFGVRLEDVDKMKQRYPAKTAGFGILYGIQGPGLSTQLRMLNLLEWDVEACEKLIAEWLNVYKGVRDYIERVYRETEVTGYSRDYGGMIRYLAGIWSRNPKVRAEAGRIAVSQRIQGGAQDWIQRSMIWLKDEIWKMSQEGLGVYWLLQVHDELVLMIEEGLYEVVDEKVRKALREKGGRRLRVPVECDGGWSDTWGGLK